MLVWGICSPSEFDALPPKDQSCFQRVEIRQGGFHSPMAIHIIGICLTIHRCGGTYWPNKDMCRHQSH